MAEEYKRPNFKFKINALQLKNIFNAFIPVVGKDYAFLVFKPDGIYSRFMNVDHSQLIDVYLPKSYPLFEDYLVYEEGKLGVNFFNAITVALRRPAKGEWAEVTFKPPDTIYFHVTDVMRRTYTIKEEAPYTGLYPEGYEEGLVPWKKLAYDVRAKLVVDSLLKSVRDLKADVIRITATADSLTFEGLVDSELVGSFVYDRRSEDLIDLDVKYPSKALYKADYLKELLKPIKPLSDVVTLKFSTNQPLQLEFFDGYISYYLAPRIPEEEIPVERVIPVPVEKPPQVMYRGSSWYAYGSRARPVDWFMIRTSIKSVLPALLLRLTRAVDYTVDSPYFDIILSPSPLTELEVKGLELTPLSELPPPPVPPFPPEIAPPKRVEEIVKPPPPVVAPPPKPPEVPPVPKPPKEVMTPEVESRLRDIFRTSLLKAGLSPDKYMPEFRVELETIRTLPDHVAWEKAIESLAGEIIAREVKPPKPPPERPPEEVAIPPLVRAVRLVTKMCIWGKEPFTTDLDEDWRAKQILVWYKDDFFELCPEHRDKVYHFKTTREAIKWWLANENLTPAHLISVGLRPEDYI